MTHFNRGDAHVIGKILLAVCSFPVCKHRNPIFDRRARSGAEEFCWTNPAFARDVKKLAAMAGQFGQLSQKLRTRVTLPGPRTESHLLPLLPESTLLYAAIPNFGEATCQILTVFREELKTNAELRAWWQKGDMATDGPKMEDRLEKFCQLSEYLGDEVVAVGQSDGTENPKFLLLAEVRKPGPQRLSEASSTRSRRKIQTGRTRV